MKTHTKPTITPQFPDELNTQIPTYQKVLILIKYYTDRIGNCSKQTIKDVLKDYGISSKQVDQAIRYLLYQVKDPKIHSFHRGSYRFGKRFIRNVGTQGKGSDEELVTDLFRIVDPKGIRIQNIEGSLKVHDWGGLEDWFFNPPPIYLDHKTNKYIKLLKQGPSLQFWIANKRPGFKPIEIYYAAAKLHHWLFERGIFGELLIDKFEIRTQYRVPYYIEFRQPIQQKILDDYLLKIYWEDPDLLNSELVKLKGELWTEERFIEFVTSVDSAAIKIDAQRKLDLIYQEMMVRVQAAMDNVGDKFLNIRESQLNNYQELLMLQQRSEKLGDSFDVLEQSSNRLEGSLQGIDYQVRSLDNLQLTTNQERQIEALNNILEVIKKMSLGSIEQKTKITKQGEERMEANKLRNLRKTIAAYPGKFSIKDFQDPRQKQLIQYLLFRGLIHSVNGKLHNQLAN